MRILQISLKLMEGIKGSQYLLKRNLNCFDSFHSVFASASSGFLLSPAFQSLCLIILPPERIRFYAARFHLFFPECCTADY